MNWSQAAVVFFSVGVTALADIVMFAIILSQAFDAPFVATRKAVARRMLTLAELKAGERLIDLGSGDGRVVGVAAKEFGAVAWGIERNPFLCAWSRIIFRTRGLSHRASITRGNFFNADVKNADVITLYLLPKTLKRLLPKLKSETKPGARIVSRTFPFSGLKPEKTAGTKPDIYLYRLS